MLLLFRRKYKMACVRHHNTVTFHRLITGWLHFLSFIETHTQPEREQGNVLHTISCPWWFIEYLDSCDLPIAGLVTWPLWFLQHILLSTVVYEQQVWGSLHKETSVQSLTMFIFVPLFGSTPVHSGFETQTHSLMPDRKLIALSGELPLFRDVADKRWPGSHPASHVFIDIVLQPASEPRQSNSRGLLAAAGAARMNKVEEGEDRLIRVCLGDNGTFVLLSDLWLCHMGSPGVVLCFPCNESPTPLAPATLKHATFRLPVETNLRLPWTVNGFVNRQLCKYRN